MTESFYSRSWHRVAHLKPKLRANVTIARHVYRGETWHVLDDRIGGRAYRFTQAAWQIIGRMDGVTTLEDIWLDVQATHPEEAPTQDEVIQLIGQLHQADALDSETLPDLDEMGDRRRKTARREALMQFINPMALRLPLIDPDRFLTRNMAWVAPAFTRLGFAIWAAIILFALIQVGMNWTALTGNLADRVLAPSNLVVLILIYPLVKLAHELGHGFAAKNWGGEVHTIGVMLLVMMPVPYVDASASSAFPQKHRRMIVAAAGMMVELLIAAFALFVWLAVEPGLVRAIAFNIMLIAGVSTVVFNGNPLLKFDGYYIFADYLGLPNLAQRANQHLGWRLRRHVLRIKDEKPDTETTRESAWLIFYSIASFIYRLTVAFAIVFFISSQMFFIGVLLAIWVLTLMLIWPTVKMLRAVISGGKMRRYRTRALSALGGGIMAVALLLFAVPMPYGTVAQGLLWPADDAIIRAEITGRIIAFSAADGDAVMPGTPLGRLENELVAADVARLSHRADELDAAHRAALTLDRTQAGQIARELEYVRDDLIYKRQQMAALELTATREGRFIMPGGINPLGRTVTEGEVVGFVMAPGDRPRIRVLVPEQAVSPGKLARSNPVVRFSEDISAAYPARIARMQPAASAQLPGPALSTQAGGWIAIDPTQPEQMRPLEPHFIVDVEVSGDVPLAARAGARAYVRFAHEAEPLANRLGRNLRQLFLSRFSI